MFRLGLWLKIRFIGMSMVCWSGISVKRNFLERFGFLIWETKEKYLYKINH